MAPWRRERHGDGAGGARGAAPRCANRPGVRELGLVHACQAQDGLELGWEEVAPYLDALLKAESAKLK
jgi:hypothetical protein